MQTQGKSLKVKLIAWGRLISPPLIMTKSFLIAICIIIIIALILFPLFVSYKAQKNSKKK